MRRTLVVANGHLSPGMQVLTKPFEMQVLAQRIRGMIEGLGSAAAENGAIAPPVAAGEMLLSQIKDRRSPRLPPVTLTLAANCSGGHANCSGRKDQMIVSAEHGRPLRLVWVTS